MQERKSRPSISTKIPTKTKMNPRKNTIKNISPDILTSQHNNRRIRSKQRHHRSRNKLYHNSHDHPKSSRDQNPITKRPRSTLMLPRPNILCTKSRNRRKHRRRNQKQKADDLLYDPHSRRRIQSTSIGNNRDHNKSNLDKSILQRNRNANIQNFLHKSMIRTKILPRQRNPGFLFHDHDQCNDHTHKLRQSSTKRSPNRTKV